MAPDNRICHRVYFFQLGFSFSEAHRCCFDRVCFAPIRNVLLKHFRKHSVLHWNTRTSNTHNMVIELRTYVCMCGDRCVCRPLFQPYSQSSCLAKRWWRRLRLEADVTCVCECMPTYVAYVCERGTKCLGELQGKLCLAVPLVHTRLGQMFTFLFPHAGSRGGSVCAPSVCFIISLTKLAFY